MKLQFGNIQLDGLSGIMDGRNIIKDLEMKMKNKKGAMENIFYGGIMSFGIIMLFYILISSRFAECIFPVLLTIIGIVFCIIGHQNVFKNKFGEDGNK